LIEIYMKDLCRS